MAQLLHMLPQKQSRFISLAALVSLTLLAFALWPHRLGASIPRDPLPPPGSPPNPMVEAEHIDLDVEVFSLPGGTPQTEKDDEYEDRLVQLGTSDPKTPSPVDLKGLKYAILLPTYVDHIPLAIGFLRSLRCLCTDVSDIDIHVIVSNLDEEKQFRVARDNMRGCGEVFGRYAMPAGMPDAPIPQATVVNLFDILPPAFMNYSVNPSDTSALLRARGKFQYQSIKKLAAALDADYDYAIWLDSEAIAVRPFSLRETFETYVKTPTIWRSRMSNTEFMLELTKNATKTLGRSIDSFGAAEWALESCEWIIEKAVLKDMVQYIENAHGTDFWTAWSEHGGPFEINLYNMHIQARKLETVDSIFSKYMVLETEREMIRFGMAPAFREMVHRTGTGFLERGFQLLRVSEIQPNYSAFLRRYGIRLFRLDDLSVAPPEVIDRFLLDTPIDILVSGAPPLHQWWQERFGKVEDGGGRDKT